MAGWSLAGALAPASLWGQGDLPTWTLAPAQVEVGGHALPLHRITGAGMLADGSIVIADAGHRRMLAFDRGGALRWSRGRDGAGPGEFRALAGTVVAGDTILVYDPGLGRVTAFTAAGELIETVAVGTYGTVPTRFHGAVSAGVYVLTTMELPADGSARLATRNGTVLLHDAVTGRSVEVDRRPLDRQYLHTQAQGFTAYHMPFFGSASITGLPGTVAIVPLDSALVELVAVATGERRRVRLPLPPRPFAADAIRVHRDSLLSIATGDARARIREVFRDLPLPDRAPPVQRAVAMGDQLWIETYRDPRTAAAEWFVIDPAAGSVMARIHLPGDAVLLGGNGNSAVLLVRDALDVESVVVREVVRPHERP